MPLQDWSSHRADERPVNVRAWLYRVAHNRCIDHLRRPTPAPADIFEMSRTPLHDPLEDAQQREDLRRLVTDVGRLPEQQRSALLMREIDGMSYADLASALDEAMRIKPERHHFAIERGAAPAQPRHMSLTGG